MPRIIQAIERASDQGQVSWSFPRGEDFSAEYENCEDKLYALTYFDEYQAYAEAYKDRLVELIANGAFNIRVIQINNICYYLSIRW